MQKKKKKVADFDIPLEGSEQKITLSLPLSPIRPPARVSYL